MALHDYMTGTDIEFEVTPNPLAAADIDLSEAKANAERRARREEIQKKIPSLKNSVCFTQKKPPYHSFPRYTA